MKPSLMHQEINEIPTMIERQLREGFQAYWEAGKRISQRSGPIVTNARGTSDHAAAYFKSRTELEAGRPVASIPPSTASIYHAKLKLNDGAMLSISQSGASPDLVEAQENAKRGGAMTFALTNSSGSSLAHGADYHLDLHAGPELAVAATKTYVASLLASEIISQGLCGNSLEIDRGQIIENFHLPPKFNTDEACDILADSSSVYTLSRGRSLAIAQEAALKLKETCLVHAEAFSAAEVIHGPMILARKNITIIAFETNDASQKSVRNAIKIMKENGAKVIAIPSADKTGGIDIAPLVQIAQFYSVIERLSLRLGYDPDTPAMLKKITQTL